MGSDDAAEVGKAGALVLIGTVLSMLSGFLFRVVNARLLSQEVFGHLVLGLSLLNVSAIVCTFGLTQGVVKYISSKEQEENWDTYITVTLATVAGLGTVLAIPGVFFAESIAGLFGNSDMPPLVVTVFIVTIPLFSVMKVLTGVYRGQMDSQTFVKINKLLRPISRLVLTGAAAYLVGTAAAVAGAFFLATALTAVAGVALLFRNGWRPVVDRTADIVPLYRFSLPLAVSASVFVLLTYFDKLAIGYYLTASDAAIYGVAAALVVLLGVFRSAFAFLLYPKISELISDGNRSEVADLYEQTTKWILLCTTPAFLILVLRPGPLIRLFGAEYAPETVGPVIGILAVGIFVDAVVGPNGQALLGFGRSKVVLIYNVIAVLLNVALNVLLIPQFGLVGAGAASVAGYLVMNGLKSADLFYNHGIRVINPKILSLAATSGTATWLLADVVPETSNPVTGLGALGFIGGISLCVGIASLYFFGMVTEADRQLFLDTVPLSDRLVKWFMTDG